jgi:hypothetical protein
MKKKITKIWSVGLVLVLAVSLLLWAAPVSAGTLSWGDEDLPEELELGSDILDVSVFPGGGVIYATTANTVGSIDPTTIDSLYRSTNRGESWSSITVKHDTTIVMVDLVAVSPDDENYVAVANSATMEVLISDDGGANWDTLGDIGSGTIRDLDLSVEKGGNHFVAVASVNSSVGEVWTYEIGAVGADWTPTHAADGWNTPSEVVGAVAFSPNFQSDEVLVALSAEFSEAIWLQVYSFNQEKWNSGTFADFPGEVVNHGADANVTALDRASIAMAPDYLGSDDAMRVLFVGTSCNATGSADEASGVFRMDDDDSTTVKDEQFIYSVDFDGTNLVAGHWDSTNVRRSSDPLASSPSVSSATSTKRPGGDNKTLAAFAGADVVAATSGDESGFSISRDDGKTFNDISLIDTRLLNLEDVATSPDGEMVYLLTNDGTTTSNATAKDLSVWRLASSWERILNVDNDDATTAKSPFIIRIAPDDADVLYVAELGTGRTMYYTNDGGDAKWHTRTARYDVTDLAAEGDGDVVYLLTAQHVSKSTNSGFTWATKVSHKITEGGNMIVSIGEDELLVGGDGTGKVSYSKDGNTTWTKLSDGMTAGDVQTIATGLEDGDFVFAASDAAGDYIYYWEIGDDDEWDKITADDYLDETGTDYSIMGLALLEGVLYAVGDNTTDSKMFRSLDPTADDPSWSTETEATDVFDSTPSALRASRSEGITKLWAIDTALPALVSYKDTLALVGPASKTPRDGADVSVNWVSGESFHVTLTWETPSDKVRIYDVNIALDSDFDEDIVDTTLTKASGTWDEGDIISAVVGPGATLFDVAFMPDTTYYWRVRVNSAGPVKSAWSEVRSFAVGSLPEAVEPVIIEQPPAPVISVPPAPAITIEPPEIVLPAPEPAPEIVIPAAPAPPAPITPAYIWAIIIIGAILVIALVVLIIRTRRPV